MSELKVINVDRMADVRSLSGRFYRKSEVDKVIEYLQNQLALSRTSSIESLAKAQHEARNNKYKRCLAMANYLGLVSALVHGETQLEYMRRELKWLKLAEKFKEAQ